MLWILTTWPGQPRSSWTRAEHRSPQSPLWANCWTQTHSSDLSCPASTAGTLRRRRATGRAMMDEKNREKKGALTLVLALATLIAAFGSSFQYGYNVAAVNSPSEIMKQFYNDTYHKRTDDKLDSFTLTLMWSLTVSMFPFGGFLGSLMVGTLVNKMGRKGALLFNNIFSIVPAILMGCSKTLESYELIIISRLLVGICAA